MPTSPVVPRRASFGAAMVLAAPGLMAQYTWRTPDAQVTPRMGQYACFDLARGRVTVFGGQIDATNYAADLWQFDDEWLHFPAANLPVRAYGAAAEDPAGGIGVLFGGRDPGNGSLFQDTLRWNRATLQFDLLSPAVSPPPRWLTAMAYDSNRHRVVLFGGGGYAGHLADTWEWDGTNWSQRTPAVNPPARANHALAYDAARQRVVLFGGHNGASLADTWTYDGTNWTAAANLSFGGYHNLMLAYDANRSMVVAFGGKDDAGTVYDTVHEWNGTTWSAAIAPATRPVARELASLTYDPQRKRLVLIGGQDQGATLLGDTWTWDGTTWSQQLGHWRGTYVEPPPRTQPIFAYSDITRKSVLFGGYDSSTRHQVPLTDTWECAGNVWQQRNVAVSPPPAYADAGCILRSTGDLYYFPGRDAAGNSYNQQWNWGGQQWSALTLSTPPIASIAHQVVGSLQTTQYGWVLVRLVTSGTRPNLVSTLQLIQPFSGLAANISVPGGPSPRTGSVMAQPNSASLEPNKVWLFGGVDANSNYLNDLWALEDVNGTLQWTQAVASGTPPTPRSGAAVTCAPFQSLGVCVYVLGGSDASGVRSDGAVFSASPPSGWSSVWSMPQPITGATATAGPGYGSEYTCSILFGGTDGVNQLASTWRLRDAMYWYDNHAPSLPAPSYPGYHGLAYDTPRHRILSFGGEYDWDLWSHDGTTWSPIVGKGAQPNAAIPILFYDATLDATVCFDTVHNSNYWILDNTDRWHARPFPDPTRTGYAITYIPTLGRYLICGGSNAGGPTGDTLLFDLATNQTTLVSTNGPTTSAGMLSWDPLRNKAVFFGGASGPVAVVSGTWEWSPVGGWLQASPASSPQPRFVHSMYFDPTRGTTVLDRGMGSVFGPAYNDVWEWNGADWRARTPENGMPNMLGGASTTIFDPRTGRGFGFPYIGGVEARIDTAGPGNAAVPEALRYYTQPVLGEPLRLGFHNPQGLGIGIVGWGPMQQPLYPLSPPLTCEPASLWSPVLSYLVLGNAEPNFTWPVPNTPVILGVTLTFQALASQPTGCWRATDALHVRF